MNQPGKQAPGNDENIMSALSAWLHRFSSPLTIVLSIAHFIMRYALGLSLIGWTDKRQGAND